MPAEKQKKSKTRRRKERIQNIKKSRRPQATDAAPKYGPPPEKPVTLTPLFEALRKLARGEPASLTDDIYKLKDWFTADREKRPSGYMNQPRTQAAYLAYHLPLHLAEMHWIRKRVPLPAFDRPQRFLDYGAGPGTASLAWLLADPAVPVERWTLADISGRALENADSLLKVLRPDLPTERRKLPEGWKRMPWRERYDHLFLSHVLNEMGSGPRLRDRKLEFLLQLASDTLEDGGLIWIVEPPLREPTMDLMWMRDQLVAEGFEILAPCPRGVEACPMAARKLGWCYTQPPRKEDAPVGLLDWDRKVERALHTRLDKSGFSFLVVRVPSSTENKTLVPAHSVALTDGDAWQRWTCTSAGAKQIEERPPYRGAWKFDSKK